jgi:hypothetical protein
MSTAFLGSTVENRSVAIPYYLCRPQDSDEVAANETPNTGVSIIILASRMDKASPGLDQRIRAAKRKLFRGSDD